MKSCFHGAGGSTDAGGAVEDMVRKKRERRWVAIREAMIAVSKIEQVCQVKSIQLAWSLESFLISLVK